MDPLVWEALQEVYEDRRKARQAEDVFVLNFANKLERERVNLLLKLEKLRNYGNHRQEPV